jgi:hypothetical protein
MLEDQSKLTDKVAKKLLRNGIPFLQVFSQMLQRHLNVFIGNR